MVQPALLREPTATAPSHRVELVTFDLDDCLWDSAEVMMRAEQSRQSALADAYPRIAARWGWRTFRTEVMAGLAETRPEIAHSPSELQKEGLRWCAAEAGYDDPDAVAALGFGAFAAARLQPTMFPGALYAAHATDHCFCSSGVFRGRLLVFMQRAAAEPAGRGLRHRFALSPCVLPVFV